MYRMTRYFSFGMMFVGLFAFPLSAYADVGSPLVWMGIGHLLIGNALIGVLEGWVIARVFKTVLARSIRLMILANYVSALIGLLGLGFWGIFAQNFDLIRKDALFFGAALAGTYVITVFVEWPFCSWAFEKKDRRPVRALQASLLVQTISYVVLAGAYALAASKSF